MDTIADAGSSCLKSNRRDADDLLTVQGMSTLQPFRVPAWRRMPGPVSHSGWSQGQASLSASGDYGAT